jgi:hypothetical protein
MERELACTPRSNASVCFLRMKRKKAHWLTVDYRCCPIFGWVSPHTNGLNQWLEGARSSSAEEDERCDNPVRATLLQGL